MISYNLSYKIWRSKKKFNLNLLLIYINLFLMKSISFLLFLVLAVLMVFHPILKNDFLYSWDDQWVVMNQYTTGGWSASNIFHIFFDFYHGQYAPFNEISYLILYSFFGYDPLHFHLASLLYHTANTVLVFVFIRKLLLLSNTEKKKILILYLLLQHCYLLCIL